MAYFQKAKGDIMSKYIEGVEDPAYTMDEGSGAWCSAEHFSDELYHYKYYLEKILSGNIFLRYRYPYALEHLQHYFSDTGADINLNLLDVMKKSRQLKQNCDREIDEAIVFCKSLSHGRHNITSSVVSFGYFISDDSDLFYAIGGYQYWGKGEVIINDDGKSHSAYSYTTNHKSLLRYYKLRFKFVFFDRYNWNVNQPDAGVRFGGLPISDRFMGSFHQQCLAREYNIHGVLEIEKEWHDYGF